MKPRLPLQVLMILAALMIGEAATAKSTQNTNIIDITKREAEAQIRNMLDPLLQKYCRDECKLMSVQAAVDLAVPDELSPGFDEIDPKSAASIEPSSARAKLLIDEKVGPNSRIKLIELLQQHLDTLDYPVKIDIQLTRFPQPIGSAAKIAELREKVTRQFKATLEDLFRQFCPNQCLASDYDLQTEIVNAEEAQYGATGEFVEDGGIALRLKNISTTLLIDTTIPPVEQKNILEMAKLKTNYFKNVNLTARTMKFPQSLFDADGKRRDLASSKADKTETNKDEKNNTLNTTTNVNSNSNKENSARQERFERIEKIERVESGDAVQAELQKFKVFGLIFACAVLCLLIFLILAQYSSKHSAAPTVHKIIQSLTSDPVSNSAPSSLRDAIADAPLSKDDRAALFAKRYEIEALLEELMAVFAQQPRVAKYVFSRILTEEGVETTARYVKLFGESVVMDMLRDPSLQSDLSELMEFYAKNPIELTDDDKLELLRKLHHRTTSGKLVVMGSRSSHLFDFLAEMDGMQILELVRNESLTVKAIILTQCDPLKRVTIYSQMDETSRMSLLTELSRIDYLPRDYIFNVANALKRKRRENPRLNTESLPGSDVLLNLLERTGSDMQKTVVRNLEMSNPDSARMIKGKLVCLDTLRHLRDSQLLEVVLSLRHDELLQFLKGAPADIRTAIFSKCPKDLVVELEEELVNVGTLSREAYMAVERKILNRMKLMANEGLINLVETNDRMLADHNGAAVPAANAGSEAVAPLKKVSGW